MATSQTNGPAALSSEARAPRTDAVSQAQSIAKAVAGKHAPDVDARSRFPHETIDAARAARMLSAAVPRELGGDGAGMRELAASCTAIAQACASSGMVLAMHHIQVACVARHARTSPYFEAYLSELAERQLLLASVTSEVGIGGDTRSSICALETVDDRFRLAKDATTVSYGEHADDLLVTCRRDPAAAPGDQVLVLLRKGDFRLERTSEWDTLGMRGTCSPGFKLTSGGAMEQVVPGSFADSSAQSMVPYSHLLWSAVWLGIASDAVTRAAAYVRAEARRKPGSVPSSATRLADVSAMLQALRHHVNGVAAEFDALNGSLDALATMGWALKLNNLKISASESASQIVHGALQITGIQGYKNDSPFSVARHYRDALSAALMIGNDRIAARNASMLLVFKDE